MENNAPVQTAELLQQVKKILKNTPNMIEALAFESLKFEFDLTDLQLVQILINELNQFSIAPISDFHVIAIALEQTDVGSRVYFGANLEFDKQALSLVVHAEQSAIHNAWLHGAKKIDILAINEAPCGFCRQFINEIPTQLQPKIFLNAQLTNFSDYLPNSFGPADLNIEQPFMSTLKKAETLEENCFASYAPYTGNQSACEITLDDGHTVFGRYIENAAFNPSLSPLQAALNQVQLYLGCSGYEQITAIRVMQSRSHANQEGITRAITQIICPEINVEFDYY